LTAETAVPISSMMAREVQHVLEDADLRLQRRLDLPDVLVPMVRPIDQVQPSLSNGFRNTFLSQCPDGTLDRLRCVYRLLDG
jgi:hypothetical protein